jgi:hypothetical protein
MVRNMETETLLTGIKLHILEELKSEPKSATELAKILHTSIANINQQLKILEAHQTIKKIPERDHKTLKDEQFKRKVGKPKKHYTLNNEFIYLAVVQKSGISKKALNIQPGSKSIHNILLLDNMEDMFFLAKFCLNNEDILTKINSLAVINTTKETLELVLLTDHLDEIRSHYSNAIIINPLGKEKKIVCWTHNELEFKEGLMKKEKYFLNLLKNPTIIFDEHQKLQELKKERDSAK